MRIFFGAHRAGLAFDAIKQARFLVDGSAGLDDLNLAARLVINRLANEPHRVDVLNLAARAQLSARAAHRDIHIGAKITLLHIAVTCAQSADNTAQLFNIGRRLFRRAHIRLGDNLHQRHTRTVQINVSFRGRKVMYGFPRILLQMEALNANTNRLAYITVCINRQNINLALTDDGMFKLANLIALRQINIEIIFTVKAREQINLRVQPKARANGLLDAKLIHHRQHARHARINKADLCIRLRAIFRGRAREELRVRGDLRMYLKTKDDLPIPRLAFNIIFRIADAFRCEHV